jgi:AraC-like DNA-binding protein
MTEKLAAKKFFEPGRIPLCVFRMPYVDWSRQIHSHDFHEMMIVVGGVAVHHLGDHHETISMGDVFVIPPGHHHGYDVPENSGVQVLNVLFDWKRLAMNVRDLEQIPGFHALFSVKLDSHFEPHLKLPARDLAVVNSIVEEIETELEGLVAGGEFLAETKFRELVVFLSRRYSHVATPSGRNVLKLGELISYMEKHLGEDLRFEELAKAIHMSPTSLRRTFQETFNCSPMAYLQQLRVKRAMLLLADPMKSISDVAFDVGFNDSGYFSRVFRQEAGETPKMFREKL